MASMMDEMAKTLARRRAQAEKKPDVSIEKTVIWLCSINKEEKKTIFINVFRFGQLQADTNNDQTRPWEKSNTLPHKLSGNSSSAQSGTTNNGTTNNGGAESPRPSRKRFGSASEETILKQVNGDGLSIANSHELEALKADILREMRIELNKATKEIIDGMLATFDLDQFLIEFTFLFHRLTFKHYLRIKNQRWNANSQLIFIHSYQSGV